MPETERTHSGNTPSALTSTLVVELGSRPGVGACGSLLAQLGATVVLVEPSAPQTSSGKWRHRAQYAAGKLSVCYDRNRKADGDFLRDLIAGADAVIVSTDVDDDSIDLLGDESKDKVICDIGAFGRSGASAGEPYSEWQIQAVAGIIETTGTNDAAPVVIPLPIVELMAGVYGAAATVAALRVRAATGIGQRIDMALYDCAFAAMATFLPRVLTGDREPIKRIGNRHTMISPWNVYKARDGWILICVGSDAQWQRLCDIMNRPELRSDPRTTKTADRIKHVPLVDETVEAWVAAQDTSTCVERLNEAQIACGPVVAIDGYPREPNLDYRNMIHRLADPITHTEIFLPGSPLRMSASPGRAPNQVPSPDTHRKYVQDLLAKRASIRPASHHGTSKTVALAGIRIIEIGHYTTVPLSTRLLASLGAEVIKIEPPEGEATRDWPPTQRGQGYFFTFMNSDKRSLVLDLRSDADAAVLRDLIKTSDVLIENLKPGALARRGFSASALSVLNPRLIYCAVSGFGAESLYAGRPAYDSVIQAMSGLMDVLRSNDVPVKTSISSADLMGAEMAVLAVLAALAYRDRTGNGQCIDLSMQDIAAWLTQTAWNGANAGPVSLLHCRDGFVVAEIDAGRLSSLASNVLGAEAASLTVHLTKREASARLSEHGISVAPILTVHEMMAEPHTQSRHLWFPVTDDGETWPLLASPLRLEKTPPAVRKPMPALGRDTNAILEELRRMREVATTAV